MRIIEWLLSLIFGRRDRAADAEWTNDWPKGDDMAKDDLIEALQRLLAASGHDPGKIDGIRGPRTEAAARAYLAKVRPKPSSVPAYLTGKGKVEWDARSAKALQGVHPDLVRVAERARQLSPRPFVVIEGLRSLAQQKANVAKGVSQTMNSRHLTGHAIDVLPTDGKGNVSFAWDLIYPLAGVFAVAATELGVPIRWGGNWNEDFGLVRSAAEAKAMHGRYRGTLHDGPHYELDRSRYPA